MAEITKEFASVVEHLVRMKVPADFIDKQNQIVQVTFPGPIVARMFVSSDGGALMFKCVFGPEMPAERLPATAELITRLNEDIHVGGFSLDWADGQVTFRTSHILAGPVTDPVMMRVIGGSVKTVERFRDAFSSVARGASPVQMAAKFLG